MNSRNRGHETAQLKRDGVALHGSKNTDGRLEVCSANSDQPQGSKEWGQSYSWSSKQSYVNDGDDKRAHPSDSSNTAYTYAEYKSFAPDLADKMWKEAKPTDADTPVLNTGGDFPYRCAFAERRTARQYPGGKALMHNAKSSGHVCSNMTAASMWSFGDKCSSKGGKGCGKPGKSACVDGTERSRFDVAKDVCNLVPTRVDSGSFANSCVPLCGKRSQWSSSGSQYAWTDSRPESSSRRWQTSQEYDDYSSQRPIAQWSRQQHTWDAERRWMMSPYSSGQSQSSWTATVCPQRPSVKPRDASGNGQRPSASVSQVAPKSKWRVKSPIPAHGNSYLTSQV